MMHLEAIKTPTLSLLNTPFLREMIQQLRTQDSSEIYQDYSNELLLKTLLHNSDLDEANDISSLRRISAFYHAVTCRLEQETGQMAEIFINLSQEGMGWVLVFCGRLLVVSKFIRKDQSFKFESLEHLATEGEKVTQDALELAREYFEFGAGEVSVSLQRAS